MFGFLHSEQRRLQAARNVCEHLAELLDAHFCVRLWDGSVIPLGKNADPNFLISIGGPGIIGSILRWPTLKNLLRHYATGQIDIHGGLMAFAEAAQVKNSKKQLHKTKKWLLLRNALPFLLARSDETRLEHEYAGDVSGKRRSLSDNKSFIRFHYDIGNDFYKLFLDSEMVYTCAYFTDWNNSLEQAQLDKLEMICRKLQLKPGEKLLDIGCGWGGLLCYAARNYGVQAHGITISPEQLDFTREKIRRLGLDKKVSVELQDYSQIQGSYDKVASVGMIEAIGNDNLPTYLKKIRSVLPDRGIFLNQGITRPAKKTQRQSRKISPEHRLLTKYIFPGGELDHIGHTISSMEAYGFRVHDVEDWRDHYGSTCKLWCQRLEARGDEAIRLVGKERYRMWLAYLCGVGLALGRGSACLFQTVATKYSAKGATGMPATRRHLYQDRQELRSAG